MSLPYGPVALTANTMTSQNIDASAKWLVIENSSIFLDLGVSFYPTQPAAPVTFSGQPWAGVVQAGDAKRFLLPRDGLWMGHVWLYPLSVANQSAATGTNSGYSRAYLTTFSELEEPTDFHGIIRGLDLTSQPRIISVPVSNIVSFDYNFTAPSDVLAQTAANAQVIPAGIAQNVPGSAGPKIYIHTLSAEALTIGRCTLALYFWWVDNTITPIAGGNMSGPFIVEASRAGAFGPSSGTNVAYTAPEAYIASTKPGAATAYYTVVFLKSGNGGMSIDLRMNVSIDSRNSGVVGGIGSPYSPATDLY